MKVCTKCHEEKSFSEFHKHPTGKFGLQPQCKKCKAEYVRKPNSEYHRKYHEEHREERNKKSQEWYKNNKDKALEANRQYYSRKMADPEKRRLERERNRQWKKDHPEETKEQNKRYAERRKQWKQPRFQTEPLEDRHWIEILEYYSYRCAYCFGTADVLEQEHKTPLSRGGNHTASNVVPACGTCNRHKGEKTVQEWLGGV